MKWTPEAIRRLRFDLGNLTQEEFAKLINPKTNQATISDWERSENVPSPMAQARLNELENQCQNK